MSELTQPEAFCVRRVRKKLLAAAHHLSDAVETANSLTPLVLADTGLEQAIRVLLARLDELKRCMSPKPEEVSNG